MPLSPNLSTGPYGLKLKAWVLFQGVGAAGAAPIVKSANVTSVTRATAGVYDVVFTAAMSSTTYAVVLRSSDGESTGGLSVGSQSRFAGSVRLTLQGVNSTGGQNPGAVHIEFWE